MFCIFMHALLLKSNNWRISVLTSCAWETLKQLTLKHSFKPSSNISKQPLKHTQHIPETNAKNQKAPNVLIKKHIFKSTTKREHKETYRRSHMTRSEPKRYCDQVTKTSDSCYRTCQPSAIVSASPWWAFHRPVWPHWALASSSAKHHCLRKV